MTIFDVLKFIGGLSLFLFGMNYMGSALEKKRAARFQDFFKGLPPTNMPAFSSVLPLRQLFSPLRQQLSWLSASSTPA